MKVIVNGLRAGLTLAGLATASMLWAQGPKKVVSHDGSCQITVPADWVVTEGFGLATSSDKTQSAIVSSPKQIPTLAEAKQIAPTVYKDDKITKDSATELQMEGESGDGKPNVYRAIPLAGKICILEVKYTSGTVDDARKIAGTLKGAK